MALNNVSTGDPHVAAHNEERAAINALDEEMGTKIPFPAVPEVGALLRWNGTEWTKSATRLFEGNGSPEGVVAAPLGSRYVDLNNPSGALEYIKRFGPDGSNTGWLLSAFSDTGWRNVLGQVGTAAGSVKHFAAIRRVGNLVDVYFDLTTPSANGNWDFYTLPPGFRPDFNRYGALQDNKENAASWTAVFATGVCRLNTIKGAWRDRYNGQWTTREPWPTVEAGTAL